jgi:hypothetical protein
MATKQAVRNAIVIVYRRTREDISALALSRAVVITGAGARDEPRLGS